MSQYRIIRNKKSYYRLYRCHEIFNSLMSTYLKNKQAKEKVALFKNYKVS